MNKILVTGGCGYIGSHTIIDLLEQGFSVISLDNYVNSDPEVLDWIEQISGVRVPNFNVDLVDREAVVNLFKQHPDIQGVIHFAALKSVGESVEQPLRYYENNLIGLLHVLEACAEFKVPNFIFSSSCSVYGNTRALPVLESTPWQEAESPYARTKQIGEQMIRDFYRSYTAGQGILLRYFNPAGAHESGLIGESPTSNVTNLVPVITETAIGKRGQMTVFGDDYDTRDGSCIRDYIHVMDLARAHTLSLKYLMAGKNESPVEVYNVGIGQGATVLEAIRAFEKVSGEKLNYMIGPRRAGDVEAIYANYALAAERLGWQPQRSMEDIMRTAWVWEQKRTK
ncbi:MAG: UDP-glucose 4-epimerase GalE [Saprospiraceae bacterium]|nr:UDP-glucose 4-epimerase GalE [Saprospiraceae bacterium]